MSADDYPGDLLGPSMPAHLYIHVPFCASKCAYCDFASVSGASDDIVRGGVHRHSLAAAPVGDHGPQRRSRDRVRRRRHTLPLSRGGHRRARTSFASTSRVRDGAEITVEGNPDSLDSEVARAFAAAGVTRISVGVQSFDDGVLRVLGRRHDAQAAWEACSAVRDAGLDLSVDLICGVPGQSITSWSETLARAVATGACHVSVYPLSVEDGTPLQVADRHRTARRA